MIRKKALGGKKFQVTFSMPAIEGIEGLSLCGEFNAWGETATPMKREPDGSWSVTLTLDGGKSYVFRYRDNRGEWHNDWSADAYVPNEFGTENSVLDLAALDLMTPRREDRAAPARQRQAQHQRSPQQRSQQKKPSGRSSGQRRKGT